MSNAVLNQLTISQYFKLSFEIWIDPNAIKQIHLPIFLSTNEVSNNARCGARWPLTEALIWSENKFNLHHSFECPDGIEGDGYKKRYERTEELRVGEWHQVDYQQLPIFNDDKTSSVAEIIIRINRKITQKIFNRQPKQYDNINIYYGSHPKNNRFEFESYEKTGKIRNFKLFELLKGLYFEIG